VMGVVADRHTPHDFAQFNHADNYNTPLSCEPVFCGVWWL
jgi:hypothetical protein